MYIVTVFEYRVRLTSRVLTTSYSSPTIPSSNPPQLTEWDWIGQSFGLSTVHTYIVKAALASPGHQGFGAVLFEAAPSLGFFSWSLPTSGTPAAVYVEMVYLPTVILCQLLY